MSQLSNSEKSAHRKLRRQQDYQQEFIRRAFEKSGEICYVFRLQKRPDGSLVDLEKDYPIEDGNVEWPDRGATRFVDVAEVKFNVSNNQGWDSQSSIQNCNKTEFSPWNGLLSHQPLGNLARARRYVYKASALVRE